MTNDFLPARVNLCPEYTPIKISLDNSNLLLVTPIKQIKPPNVDDFTKDTYQLITDFFNFDKLPGNTVPKAGSIVTTTSSGKKYYFSTIKPQNLAISRRSFFTQHFAPYCEKYGNIFSDSTDIQAISMSLITLYSLLVIQQVGNIHTICGTLAKVIEYSEKNNNNYEYVTFSLLVPVGDEVARLSLGVNTTSYDFTDFIVHAGISSDFIKIRLKQTDIAILTSKSTVKKREWLLQRLCENISGNIILSAATLVWETGLPIIQSHVVDPLTIFILQMVINSKNYNICRNCRSLITERRTYCANTNCKQLYHSNNPVGKIDNLLRQWKARGFFDKAGKEHAPFIKSTLKKYGEYWLSQGYEHNEIIKLLKERYKCLIEDKIKQDN